MVKNTRVRVMRIWVDGQAFQSGSRYRGIGRYVIELLQAITKADPSIELLISFNLALPDTIAHARELVSHFIDPSNIHTFHGMTSVGERDNTQKTERQLSEVLLAHHVALLNPDVAISTSPFEGCYDACVPLTSKEGHDFPIVGIFYDAIPIRFADTYLQSPDLLNYYLNRLDAYKQFDWTLSISDFSDQELQKLVGPLPSTPIYAGLSSHFTEPKNINEAKLTHKSIIDKPYILSVGGLDWRKNVPLIVEAFGQLDPSLEDLHFVIAGPCPEGDKASISNVWRSKGLNPDRLVFAGQVEDSTLHQLYKHAACLIQPSFMEGFGLTVLEAVSCNTPVIVADAGALPEVLGTKAGLFDPNNSTQLADSISHLFENSHFGDTLLKSAQQQMTKFTWEKVAERCLRILRQITVPKPQNELQSSQVNKITLNAIKAFDFKKQTLAEALAFATPPLHSRETKTFWDVSSTANSDAGTGIQRVVNKTAEIVQNRKNNTLLASIKYDGSFPGFFEVDRKKGRYTRREKTIIDLNGPDKIVMLDSSWDLIKYHAPELRRMKLFGGKIFTVLYDLVPIRTPGFCDPGLPEIFCEWFEEALQYSDGFICISQAVADELATFIKGIGHTQPLKIGFWHLGSDFSTTKKVNTVSRKNNLKADKQPHFLMVGTLEPRKGHKVVLDALKIARAKGFSGHLTIVGRQGWNIAGVIREIQIQEKLCGDLTWINNADDTQLAELYRECDAVICASFAEGFGLPIVEAQAYGRPIIASDIDVFREVSDMSNITFFSAGDSVSLADELVAFTPQSSAVPKGESKILSWKESSDRLVKIVEQEDWYLEYKPPRYSKINGSRRDDLRMPEQFQPVPHSLRLLQKPILGDHNKYLVLIGLEIYGNQCLSRLGPKDSGIGGVSLGIRRVTKDGLEEISNSIRQEIPYAVVEGLEFNFSFSIDRVDWETGNDFAIELVQENANWWGSPLIVNNQS